MKEFVDQHSAQYDIDFTQLQNQVEVAWNMFRTQNDGMAQAVLEISEDQQSRPILLSPLDVFVNLRKMTAPFPDLVKFYQLVLCLPVSSACAERSFSAMKRIKTYLHSSMSEHRLSDVAILSIERELSYALLKHPSVVVDKFAYMGNRLLMMQE